MTTTQIKEPHGVDCNKGGELASLHVFDLGVFSIEHEQNNSCAVLLRMSANSNETSLDCIA